MLEKLKKENNYGYTENGAVTYKSTQSDCLDLFSTIGAMRYLSDKEIINRFVRAYIEDADLAMKILFYGRDVREGLGQRRTFRVIIKWLAQNHKDSFVKNMSFIPEYGRFDDLLEMIGTDCEKNVLEFIAHQLKEDLSKKDGVSLLAKWLPSINASDERTIYNAKIVAKYLNMSLADYRKTLSLLRKKIGIVENNLREKDYTFDYAKQPSKAMFKYHQAFLRNDEKRYNEFLQEVLDGKKTLHINTLMPYEIVRQVLEKLGKYGKLSEDEKLVFNTTWESLPNYCDGSNALAVVDTSGSMYWYDALPAAVALSLGIYFGERNVGVFHNHFIEFSDNPQLLEIKGDNFIEHLEYLLTFNKVAGTNIEALFDLILNCAIKNKLPQEELPETLYIISDMEFNACIHNASMTNFENAKLRFEACGYKLPKIIFWNVASRNRNQAVEMNEEGVALVSGCSPRLFSMATSGELSPYKMMMEVLSSKRYENIKA